MELVFKKGVGWVYETTVQRWLVVGPDKVPYYVVKRWPNPDERFAVRYGDTFLDTIVCFSLEDFGFLRDYKYKRKDYEEVVYTLEPYVHVR